MCNPQTLPYFEYAINFEIENISPAMLHSRYRPQSPTCITELPFMALRFYGAL